LEYLSQLASPTSERAEPQLPLFITAMSPPSIKSLPRELVVFIATYLSIDEVVNFSLTCRHFGHLAQSDYTCKLVLEVALPLPLLPVGALTGFRKHLGYG